MLSNVWSTHVIRHRIDTGNALPLKDKFRYPLLVWRTFQNQEIERLLFFNQISEAMPARVPMRREMSYAEKDWFCLCIGYRQLNALKVKDAYPLPGVDDFLISFLKARYFAEINLLISYHKVEV